MMTALISRIEKRLDALKISARAASMTAGLNPDAIRDIKRGTSKNPSLDTLRKLADALQCSVEYLLGNEPETVNRANINLESPEPRPDTTLSRAVDIPGFATMNKDVPVRGTTMGGDDGDFTMNGEIVDSVRRPPGLASNGAAFGLYVIGESMLPRFEPGELVFVNPNRQPTPGCDIVIELLSSVPDTAGPCYIKRLLRVTADHLHVREFHPEVRDFTFEKVRIKNYWRIMTSAELMGVG